MIRYARPILLTLIAALLVTPAGAVPGPLPEPLPPSAPHLHLKAGSFDPLAGAPPVPEELLMPETAPYFVVQFSGPVREEWKRAAEALGVELLHYLPDYGFLARVQAGKVDELRRSDGVRYVGPYQPGYKVEPGLLALRGDVELAVLLLGDFDRAEAEMRALGAAVEYRDGGFVWATAPAQALPALARIPEVWWLEQRRPVAAANDQVARILKLRQQNDGPFAADKSSLWSYNGGAFEGTTGSNVIVAVSDTGVDGNHVDFTNKKVWYKSYLGGADWTDPDGHGTHVSGTVLGSGQGQNGKYAGMAPGARLIGMQSIGATIAPEAANAATLKDAYDHAADIITNSWGQTSGWGNYGAMAAAYDRGVRDSDQSTPGNQTIIVVFAAGNEASTGVREPATAKNVITVGATTADGSQVASFSSDGPTDDGRLKPDVMAPGVDTTSARAGSANGYMDNRGTSMAAPAIAGSAAAIVQYYRDNYGFTPSAALVKALLMNSGEPLASYAYPGFQAGWGRANLVKALYNTTSRKVFSEDQRVNVTTGTSFNYTVQVVSQSSPFRVTLVWTDRAGSPPGLPALVNNLDLVITSPTGATYYGNRFSGGQSAAGGGRDPGNNTEGFHLSAPVLGEWRIRVEGANVPQGPQDYALVVSGDVNFTDDFTDLYPDGALRFDPPAPVEGGQVRIDFAFRNAGTLPAAGTRYRLMVDGAAALVNATADMPKNSSLGGTVFWTAARGKHIFRLELDPANLVKERNETNNWRDGALNVLYHDVSLSAVPYDSVADPGGTARYELEVWNSGTANDTVSLISTASPPGWRSALESPLVQADAGKRYHLNFTATPPANASAGETGRWTLTAISQGNSTYRTTANLSLAVNQVYNLSLALDAPAAPLLPGERAVVNGTVANLGNGPDTFLLTPFVPGVIGWSTDVDRGSVTLGRGEKAVVAVNITPPASALAGTRVSLNMSAQSSSGAGKVASVPLEVAQVFRVSLDLNTTPLAVPAGSKQSFALAARNGGNGADRFAVSVSGPSDWSVAADRTEVSLAYRAEETANISISVPPTELAGTYRVTVTALLSNGTAVVFEREVTVMQYHRVALEPDAPDRTVLPGGEVRFNITLFNRGNGNETGPLSVTGLPPNWLWGFSDGSPRIPPFESTVVELFIRCPNGTAPNSTFRATVKLEPKGSKVYNTTTVSVFVLEPPPQPKKTEPKQGGGTVVGDRKAGEFPWPLIVLVAVAGIASAAGIGLIIGRRQRGRARARMAGDGAGAGQGRPYRHYENAEGDVEAVQAYGSTIAVPTYEPGKAGSAPGTCPYCGSDKLTPDMICLRCGRVL